MSTCVDRTRSRVRTAGAVSLAVACTLLLASAPAFASSTILAGSSVAGDHPSSADPGHAEVYETTAGTSGSVSSISLFLDSSSAASALEVGLYADDAGQPTTLLTSGRTDSPTAGWNEVSVPAADLQAGKTYWIALLDPSDSTGTLVWTDRAGGDGGGEQTSGGVDLETLPDVWVTGGLYNDGPLSAYVSGDAAAVAPALTATPSSLSFWAPRGVSPAAKTVAIGNAADGTLSYSVSDDASWLSVSPASGTTPGTITATPSTAGLSAGTYTATIHVTAAGADPRDIPVTLTVNPTRTDARPVGAWSFDETSGDTAADSSGHGNVGTLQGATHSAGVYGGGVSFDGASDWVTVADSPSLDLKSGMTLEAWVKPQQLDNAWRTVLIKEQTDQLSYALYANTDANLPSGNVFTDADHGLAGTRPLPIGEWTHLAATWDGATLRVFVNGAEVSSMPLSGTAVTSSGALRIGGNAIWGEWFNGQIDEVRVYDHAISQSDLLADRDTPISRGSGQEMRPWEKLRAALMRLFAHWRHHLGEWIWHARHHYFHGV